MTRRRPLPGFSVSTKGHSVLRKYAYGSPSSSPPTRRSYNYGYDYTNVSPVRSRYYSAEEDYIDSAVRRATSVGADSIFDTLDTANMSRNRDYDLISQTNAAIVNAETHSSPRAAVASLRARSRPQAQPVSARNVSPVRQVAFVRASSAPPLGQPVVVFAQPPRQSRAREPLVYYGGRARSPSVVRSRSVDRDYGEVEYMLRYPLAPRAIREALDYRARPSRKDEQTDYLLSKYDRSIRQAQRAMSPYRYYDYEPEVIPSRQGHYYISPATARYYNVPWQYRMLENARSLTARRPYRRFRRSLANQSEAPAIPYYELTFDPRYRRDVIRLLDYLESPRPKKRKTRNLLAAIVASKLEEEPGARKRRTPRSKYAADKYRATHRVGENPLYYSAPEQTSIGLTASRGSVQKTTDRKAIRDMDGNFTKPKNILSWQRY